MKNLLKNSVLVMVVLFTITGLANVNKTDFVCFNEDGLKKTTLTLQNVKQGEQLSILDNYGTVIYTELIKFNGTYKKGFDLSMLPDGNYYFELDKVISIKTIPFNVSFNNITFNKEAESIIYKPFVKVEDSRVIITQLALDKNALNIQLFYTKDSKVEFESIHSETITNNTNISRIYKLDESKTGSYKLVFKSNGKVFTEYFTL